MSDTPCALIALRDPITTGRLKMILKQRGWTTESTSSSEDAVSIYPVSYTHLTLPTILLV